MKKQLNEIQQAILKHLIKEEDEKKDKKDQGDIRKAIKSLSRIEDEIENLCDELEKLGVGRKTKTQQQLLRMLEICSEMKPLRLKIAKLTESNPFNMREADEQEFELDVMADKRTKDAAVDMSKDYDMDMRLVGRK